MPFYIGFIGSRVRPKVLQAVDVPIIDNRMCEEWHSTKHINVVIYDEMMCAGYRGGGKDSCQVNFNNLLILFYFLKLLKNKNLKKNVLFVAFFREILEVR